MRKRTRRRLASFAIGVPAVFASWTLLLGLPLALAGSGEGRLVARTFKLTGSGATNGAARNATADSGWTAPVPVEPGTQSVTLSWSGAPSGSVAIRSRSGGRWSTWTTDAAQPDDGPDQGGNGRTGIGPVWLGHAGAEEVQVRVVRGPLTDLSLDAMRWVEPTAGARSTTADEQPTRPQTASPTIHLTSEWARAAGEPTTRVARARQS